MAFGDLLLDPDCGDVLCGDRVTHLTRQQSCMLEALICANGRTLKREYLMGLLWHGADDGPEDKTADVYIHRIRRKLADVGSTVSIVNRYGFGFCVRRPVS